MEDETIGWHHQLNGHEFEQDDEGQGNLACSSPWGHKELDTTEQQLYIYVCVCLCVYIYIKSS